MFTNSYVSRSGQSWKFGVSFFSVFFGLIGFFTALKLNARESPDLATFLILTGMLLSVFGFIWICVAIRCRSCGTRIVWHAMKTNKVGTWYEDVFSRQSCPACNAKP